MWKNCRRSVLSLMDPGIKRATTINGTGPIVILTIRGNLPRQERTSDTRTTAPRKATSLRPKLTAPCHALLRTPTTTIALGAMFRRLHWNPPSAGSGAILTLPMAHLQRRDRRWTLRPQNRTLMRPLWRRRLRTAVTSAAWSDLPLLEQPTRRLQRAQVLMRWLCRPPKVNVYRENR